MARRRLLDKGAASLPSLAPMATYMALAPYVGPEEACAVANGDGRSRPVDGDSLSFPPQLRMSQTRWAINSRLGARWATAEELADELHRPVATIAAELEELEDDGLVERIVPLDAGRPTEWTNTKALRLIDGEDWAALTAEERRHLTVGSTQMTISDLTAGLRSERFGRRLDEHHTRLILELDEEGWSEIAEIHRAAFNATQAVKDKTERRLRENGGKAICGRSVQLLFELSPEET